MTGIGPKIGGGGADTSLDEILFAACGVQSMTHDPRLQPASSAPTAGTIYLMALPVRTGMVITNVAFQIATAAAGTVPTNMYVTLVDSTGKVLVTQNDVKGNAAWLSTGIATFALSSAYTVPSDGIVYACLLQVGSWGTTQVSLSRGGTITWPSGGQINSVAVYATGGAGVSTVGAVGTTLTKTAGGFAYWVGLT